MNQPDRPFPSKNEIPKPPHDLALPKITVQMLADYGQEGFFEKTDQPVEDVAGVGWSQEAVDFACMIVRPAVWAEIERLKCDALEAQGAIEHEQIQNNRLRDALGHLLDLIPVYHKTVRCFACEQAQHLLSKKVTMAECQIPGHQCTHEKYISSPCPWCEIERLRDALERYGRHAHPNCHDLTLKQDGSFGPRNGCLCGFDATLAGASSAPKIPPRQFDIESYQGLYTEPSAVETKAFVMMNDIPYHTIPQDIIDKVVEARRWFDEHSVERWSIAGVGPLPLPEETSARTATHGDIFPYEPWPRWTSKHGRSSKTPAECAGCGGKTEFPNIPCSICGRYPDGTSV